MHSVLPDSAGPAAVAPQKHSKPSTSLPFGHHIPLSSIKGSTYLTAQTLVQQVTYALSHKIFTYSESFDLDVAAKAWAEAGEPNARGYPTQVESMQTRNGAASAVLGYILSPDLDRSRRAIPQTILASSASLKHLRFSLNQLSLLNERAVPFVAHVAAVNYNAGSTKSLTADYASTITLAEDLGFGLVASSSAHEVQHMALFATLLAKHIPTIHVYDGVTAGRETFRADDVLDQKSLYEVFDAVSSESSIIGKRTESAEDKAQRVLKSFNVHLGTAYQFFEYEGHPQAEHILVVFGTIESSVSIQAASALVQRGEKVGVLSVRLYRPFVEEEFLKITPKTAKTILVLGQVQTQQMAEDPADRSRLFEDVLATVSSSAHWSRKPHIEEIKYASVQFLDPQSIITTFRYLARKGRGRVEDEEIVELSDTYAPLDKQYIIWDIDDSSSANVPTILSQLFANDSSRHVTINSNFDNLVQGGSVRTDIRDTTSSVDAACPISNADLVYVGNANLLGSFDVTRDVKSYGTCILRFPGLKAEDVAKKLALSFRKSIAQKSIKLYIFDSAASPLAEVSPVAEPFLTELAILSVARPSSSAADIRGLSNINGDLDTLNGMSKELESVLREVEVPESWAKEESDQDLPVLPFNININSFAASDKAEIEQDSKLESWEVAAKALAFPETYSTESSLKPELPAKTYKAYVKENRRLTPSTYDRNIFHVEFDIGAAGLKYQIGEALGIHAENDPEEVSDFIKWYGLDANALVQVPSLKDPSLLETRTVYQTILQNIDIFGRPPKKFYSLLGEHATDPAHQKALLALGGPEGATEFKRRAEVDTSTFADVLAEFPSAHPPFPILAQLVSPLKRREYSIASSQQVTPTSVALLVVVVQWTDTKNRTRYGQATRFLQRLRPGTSLTVSVKPSVMKLPTETTAPIILAGLGTGLAPFRAFVQHRAYQRDVLGLPIGPVLLYMGSRHQREEYLYGEEWEAYRDAGVVTLLGRAFSRDQPKKIYIQDRMRESLEEIVEAYLVKTGAFYLCGPTWPVPDVTAVLEEAVRVLAGREGRKVTPSTEIMQLKEDGRYVLEVY
ncbi:MAG: hypothetical protein M1814_003876 [Vezdaea aestivalis]|nr:MAG: hypothetical protein M1814_003876 [Vezdaea aestivalis]